MTNTPANAELLELADKVVTHKTLNAADRHAIFVALRTSPRSDEVREALLPFAQTAEVYDTAQENKIRRHIEEGRGAPKPHADHYRVSISIGDCRRARAALAQPAEAPAGCICQNQHRLGYCTEPGCRP